MARVTMPLLSQDARGSVSGVQFSRNRSGNFGSRKSTSTRAQSDRVTNWRAKLKEAHSAWLNLSEQLRSSWEAYAGPTQTGRNAFVGACLRLFSAGLDAPSVDPRTPASNYTVQSYNWRKLDHAPPTGKIVLQPPAARTEHLFLSWAHTYRDSMPHLRKFFFVGSHDQIVPTWFFTAPFYTPLLAIRLSVVQTLTGILLADYRWVIDPDVNQDLYTIDT